MKLDISRHQSVLVNEVISHLVVKQEGIYVDCTLGFGGHSSAILSRLGQSGRLIGIESDPETCSEARLKVNDQRFEAVLGTYQKIDFHLIERGITKVDGIFADLGVSSAQLDQPGKGFSFRLDGPLDMRMDPDLQTAEEIVNTWSTEDLARIFREYGEEPKAWKIATAIEEERRRSRIVSTVQLAELVHRVYHFQKGRIDTATKIFQALRITVNHELENLETLLSKSQRLLNSGGRIAIISYHSLEDRIVKNFFRDKSRSCTCPKELPECRCGGIKLMSLITRKCIFPDENEISLNPRSRSARLRVAEYLGSKTET
ncbi:MAG: 16S rRNA (cytosine(1402)-N(4))-methyltransferase RsmH [Candidatus Wallbacteria bacterium]|nr:16S rRNA (cytosine(1402)-N(4))-methyltransferase RsmH [Candidatus Wallbacteria bacterium]